MSQYTISAVAQAVGSIQFSVAKERPLAWWSMLIEGTAPARQDGTEPGSRTPKSRRSHNRRERMRRFEFLRLRAKNRRDAAENRARKRLRACAWPEAPSASPA